MVKSTAIHNKLQQHVEAIYGSFDFIVLHVPPEKHPTENGVIAGKLHSLDRRSRNAYDRSDEIRPGSDNNKF